MWEATARVLPQPSRVRLLEPRRALSVLERDLGEIPRPALDVPGAEAAAFDDELAAFLGVGHTCRAASATDALARALRALLVGPGDEVLLQANAPLAALAAIERVGATPVPVDIRLEDLGPDPAEVERRTGPRTRAAVVVHLHGFPVDVRETASATGRRLPVVEDVGQATGATLDGHAAGTLGAIAAVGLGRDSILSSSGAAGAVCTDDLALAARLRSDPAFDVEPSFDSHRALLLRLALRRVDERIARRAQIARYYTSRLRGRLVPPPVDPRRTHAFHRYVVRTARRTALRAFLHRHGIDAAAHYPVPIHRGPAWRNDHGPAPHLPRAEQAAREVLSLPAHADLTDTEVDRVAETTRRFFD